MRKCVLFFSFFLILFFLKSCDRASNRVHFTINPEDRKIVIPMRLNDSVTANMMFDTGSSLGSFILDHSWLLDHSSCLPEDIIPDTVNAGSVWTGIGTPGLQYNNFHRSVSIGNRNFEYNRLLTYDWKNYAHPMSDGLINIPEKDTTHVWELNFANNYVEIHEASRFKMPKDCFLLQMVKYEDNPFPFYINIPMHLISDDGDTLTTNYVYEIDLAMPEDIAFWSDERLEFFSNNDNAVWTRSPTPSGYKRYYTLNATLFEDFHVDSLRIYIFNNSYNKYTQYLIGQNFLKRFNVFFDLKNNVIGLQPIKNFQRIVNPHQKRFYYMSRPNSAGRHYITFMADYEENYFIKAGLQTGDQIVTINDIPTGEITREQTYEFYDMDTLVYQIIRDRKPMTIIVPVDKNHAQGD